MVCLRQEKSNIAAALLAVLKMECPCSMNVQAEALRPQACGDTACCYAGGVHTCCTAWRHEGMLCEVGSMGHCWLLCRLAV